jgi:hypothetical protein
MALTLVKKAPVSKGEAATLRPIVATPDSRWARLWRLASAIFWISRCWHRKMSWPLTRDGCTFRVCLRCGMRRNFDLEKWKMTGGYYYGKDQSEFRELSLTKGTKQ